MNNWYAIKDGAPEARAMYHRHYSYANFRAKHPKLFVGPGEKMVLMTSDSCALFVWRKFIDDSGQFGINCAIFRNEYPEVHLSSELILEAEQLAWDRWPGERLYTYINAKKIKSVNPGYCFKIAGWKVCGKTISRKLIILEKFPMELMTQ